MADPANPAPHKIDPAELAAVSAAIRKEVNTFTFWGQSVGGYVTDEQIREVATIAIQASAAVRAGK